MKVICKSMVMAAAADAAWFQTFPAFGEYPVGGVIKGANPDAVFVFDEDVAQQIVADFKAQREALRAVAWTRHSAVSQHEHASPEIGCTSEVTKSGCQSYPQLCEITLPSESAT